MCDLVELSTAFAREKKDNDKRAWTGAWKEYRNPSINLVLSDLGGVNPNVDRIQRTAGGSLKLPSVGLLQNTIQISPTPAG